jgi:hypothetical protein
MACFASLFAPELRRILWEALLAATSETVNLARGDLMEETEPSSHFRELVRQFTALGSNSQMHWYSSHRGQIPPRRRHRRLRHRLRLPSPCSRLCRSSPQVFTSSCASCLCPSRASTCGTACLSSSRHSSGSTSAARPRLSFCSHAPLVSGRVLFSIR